MSPALAGRFFTEPVNPKFGFFKCGFGVVNRGTTKKKKKKNHKNGRHVHCILCLFRIYHVPGTVPFIGNILVHTTEMAITFLQFPGGIFCELASTVALVSLVFHFPGLSSSCFLFFPYYMFLCKMPQIPNTELVINNKRMFLVSHVPAFFALNLISYLRTRFLSP